MESHLDADAQAYGDAFNAFRQFMNAGAEYVTWFRDTVIPRLAFGDRPINVASFTGGTELPNEIIFNALFGAGINIKSVTVAHLQPGSREIEHQANLLRTKYKVPVYARRGEPMDFVSLKSQHPHRFDLIFARQLFPYVDNPRGDFRCLTHELVTPAGQSIISVHKPIGGLYSLNCELARDYGWKKNGFNWHMGRIERLAQEQGTSHVIGANIQSTLDIRPCFDKESLMGRELIGLMVQRDLKHEPDTITQAARDALLHYCHSMNGDTHLVHLFSQITSTMIVYGPDASPPPLTDADWSEADRTIGKKPV